MNNIIEIVPTQKKSFGKTKVPGSKSYTNRSLLLAALGKGVSTLKNSLESDDTKAMINALRLLGVRIEKKGTTIRVYGRSGKFKKPLKPLYVENAGTAVRFLTAALSTQKFPCAITGNKRMQERPIQDLIQALQKLEVEITTEKNNGCPPVLLKGSGIRNYKTQVNGNISSQYLSALLMAAPCAEKPITIEVKGKLTSPPYIQMTLQSMKDFGVTIEHDKNFKIFTVAPQIYSSKNISIESDASSATYPLALAAIHGGKITLQNIGSTSLQADIQFAEVLKKFGCKVKVASTTIEVIGPQKLKSIGEIDLNNLPDAAMTVAIVAAFASGVSKLKNIGNLRVKECDRLHALATELQKIGVQVKEGKNDLTINGDPQNLHGAIIETYNDHRIAMCFGIVGSKVPNIKISNPNCVRKTYPSFWKNFTSLGVKKTSVKPKQAIVMAGMRGSGKSTLGKSLAKKLNWEFIDTDELIETECKEKISTIVKKHGWNYFRNLEVKIAKKIAKKKRAVVSTGGGFFINPVNIKLMRQMGTVILLTSDLQTIAKRISGNLNRPRLTKGKSLINELKTIWNQRKNYYKKASDFSFDTSEETKILKKDLDKKTEQILDTLITYNLIKK